MAAFLLCPHGRGWWGGGGGVHVHSSLVSLLIGTLTLLGQDITLMTSFDLNYLLNIVTLGIRSSTYKFRGTQDSP